MRVLYLAWLRTKVGRAEEVLDPPPAVTTVAVLIEWLKGRSAGHAEALADLSVVRAAVNEEFAALDAPVRAEDEVALFPPVTGGSS